MRYILSHISQPVLAKLAQQRTLCAFDFDGTLAPIVQHPDLALLPVSTRQLLTRLAALYPCVILSGRGRADLLGKLSGVDLHQVIGNHGADHPIATHRGPSSRVVRWKAAIELELGPVPGLWVENKGRSLAVHYRQSQNRADVKDQILKATRNLERARVFGGKFVVNVVVDGDPHKGTALVAERERLQCDWALYVGDDENDEDAFAMDGNIISIRIGKKLRSHARYYLRTQPEIDHLLERMVTLREHIRISK
jgi:trehalose 6-phosphate phosphatase